MASDALQPAPDSRTGHAFKPPHVPAVVGTVGMWLFLAALFMLFAAAMLGFVVVRLQAENPGPGMSTPAVPGGSLHYPSVLWLSTVFVIGVSIALRRAVHFLRLERQSQFRVWLMVSIVLAFAFLAIQAPAMGLLVLEHQRLRRSGLFLYGLVFILVLLHALHVLGGMIALVRVAVRGRHGVYDHEHYLPVRHAEMYWHFLDLVWLAMFVTFLATR